MTTRPTYVAWLCELHKHLTHPSAVELVKAPGVLEVWHRFGAHPKRVANMLNERQQAEVKRLAIREKVSR